MCKHKINLVKRVGRTHYVCSICGEDRSLEVILLTDTEESLKELKHTERMIKIKGLLDLKKSKIKGVVNDSKTLTRNNVNSAGITARPTA